MLDAEKGHLLSLKGQLPIPTDSKFPIHLSDGGDTEERVERLKEVRNLAASIVVMERALCKAKNVALMSNKVKTNHPRSVLSQLFYFRFIDWLEMGYLGQKGVPLPQIDIYLWEKRPINLSSRF